MTIGTVTSTGLGSGLDIEALVTGLVAAERQPTESKIARAEERTTSLISALGQITSSVASIQSTVDTLNDSATFTDFTASTDQPGAVLVNVGDGASAGSYDIQVDALATRQSLASGTFASTDSIVGSGVLTIDIGSPTYSGSTYSAFAATSSLAVSIGADSTLADVRDAINAEDAGVEASLVKDGGEYRLLLVAEQSGVESSLQISITGDSDGNDADGVGLSQLAFNTTSSNLTQTNAATDASFSINGLALTSASNQIDDALDGLDITLVTETTTAARIEITEDRNKITTAISEFVDQYNAYVALQNGLSSFNPDTEFSGPLSGDFSARSIASSLRSSVTSAISGAPTFYDSLATIGITTTSEGLLEFDEALLTDALDADKTAVMTLFTGDEDLGVEGVAQRLTSTLDGIIGTSGLLETRTESLSERRDSYEDQRIALERRMQVVEARYRAQFNALDILISELETTGDFLQSQLASLPFAPKQSD